MDDKRSLSLTVEAPNPCPPPSRKRINRDTTKAERYTEILELVLTHAKRSYFLFEFHLYNKPQCFL